MIAAAGLKILPVDNLDEAARWVFQRQDHFLTHRPTLPSNMRDSIMLPTIVNYGHSSIVISCWNQELIIVRTNALVGLRSHVRL